MVRHVATLGSSFAAGPGIPPLAERSAGRSERNYAHLLAAALGARLTDLSVSGATTANLVDSRQRLLWNTWPPQVSQVPTDVDLVTITAGGNDLHYLGTLLRLGHARALSGRVVTRPLGALLGRRPVPPVTDADVGRAADGLVAVVTALQQRVPAARVLLVDYLPVLGAATTNSPAAPFDDATRRALVEIGQAVATAFARAASGSAAELVALGAISAGHEIGSPQPWTQDFRIGRSSSFHPNAVGMRAVSDAILAHLAAPPARP